MSDVCKHVLTFMTNVFPRFFIQSAVVQYSIKMLLYFFVDALFKVQ